MGERLLNEEQLQDLHCDPSRGTPKGARILRNVGEVATYFPFEEKILCVGCGDGLELEAWGLLGYQAIGLDISKAKVVVAKAHGCKAWKGSAEGLIEASMGIQKYGNIYCAHTLEHLQNAGRLLDAFSRIAIDTIAIIVPIEKNGTRNPSHHIFFRSIGSVQIPGWRIVRAEERYNHEPEGLVVFKR